MDNEHRLIVALDDSLEASRVLIDELQDSVSFYKLGWQSIMEGGRDFVRDVQQRGRRVFVDLKIHDIDVTVQRVMEVFLDGVFFTTLYGTQETVRAAVKGRGKKKEPRLLLLTWLSSMDESAFHRLGGKGGVGGLQDFVVERAMDAYDAGGDGVIASGAHVAAIRKKIDSYNRERSFFIVVPGVRPKGAGHDEHRRVLTPYEAMRAGADYLVVGRPITQAPKGQRLAIVRAIDAEMKRGRQDRT